MANKGKMVVVSAPSGAGKTTIVKQLINQPELGLEFSISACSRPRRKNEMDGVDYFFMTAENFKKKVAEDAFIEWEEVYEGHFYGTLKSEVERIWEKGHTVIFDVDVIGGLNIKKKYPDQTLAIFVKPPSLEELQKRLENRSTDSEDHIAKRVEKARYELEFAEQFDVQVDNTILTKAIETSITLVYNFIYS